MPPKHNAPPPRKARPGGTPNKRAVLPSKQHKAVRPYKPEISTFFASRLLKQATALSALFKTQYLADRLTPFGPLDSDADKPTPPARYNRNRSAYPVKVARPKAPHLIKAKDLSNEDQYKLMTAKAYDISMDSTFAIASPDGTKLSVPSDGFRLITDSSQLYIKNIHTRTIQFRLDFRIRRVNNIAATSIINLAKTKLGPGKSMTKTFYHKNIPAGWEPYYYLNTEPTDNNLASVALMQSCMVITPCLENEARAQPGYSDDAVVLSVTPGVKGSFWDDYVLPAGVTEVKRSRDRMLEISSADLSEIAQVPTDSITNPPPSGETDEGPLSGFTTPSYAGEVIGKATRHTGFFWIDEKDITSTHWRIKLNPQYTDSRYAVLETKVSGVWGPARFLGAQAESATLVTPASCVGKTGESDDTLLAGSAFRHFSNANAWVLWNFDTNAPLLFAHPVMLGTNPPAYDTSVPIQVNFTSASKEISRGSTVPSLQNKFELIATMPIRIADQATSLEGVAAQANDIFT